MSWMWDVYLAHRDEIVPLVAPLTSLVGSLATVAVGLIVARAALRQARTATQQVEIARLRHEEQTKADFQRRTTESFAKAVEQLGSDKVPVRLGGIYTLERISRESEADYWSVMETLTAFVRERARWVKDDDTAVLTIINENHEKIHRPVADVSAVLTVIRRRSEESRIREHSNGLRLDLTSSDLRGAHFMEAHLERANLSGAHLEDASFWKANLQGALLVKACFEGASLVEAHLQGALLIEARLEGVDLSGAHLEGAIFGGAHLQGVNLTAAHLEGAYLSRAHLGGANLSGAHLEGAFLNNASGLMQSQLEEAFGDAATQLPQELDRPAHWAGSTSGRSS